jgi:hypothetical protein
MNAKGTKHLIECHCILPQYKNRKNPVFHKFIVFSEIDESDTVVPKFVQCNNCNVVHKVFDICKSEISFGRDELKTVTTIEEIRFGIPGDVQHILDNYNCDLPTWEMTKYIIDNEKWGESIVLTQEEIDGSTQGKSLVVSSKNSFKIESFVRKDIIG